MCYAFWPKGALFKEIVAFAISFFHPLYAWLKKVKLRKGDFLESKYRHAVDTPSELY